MNVSLSTRYNVCINIIITRHVSTTKQLIESLFTHDTFCPQPMKVKSETITNYQYVQLMKDVENNRSLTRKQITSKAFHLYHNINEQKNYFAINKLLKICCINAPNHIFTIWEDIISTDNINRLSLGLIVKCISSALKRNLTATDIQKCINILQYILENHDPLRFDDIYVRCALIHAYGLCSELQNSIKTFNSIATDKINAGCIGSMMCAYIHNRHYTDAISLYQKYHSLSNDVTHLLVIKACQYIDDCHLGYDIIKRNIDYTRNNAHSMELLNTLIDFYGVCKDIQSAEAVFDSISTHKFQKRNIININTMMTCYLNNCYYNKCLRLYKSQHSEGLKDDVSHLLALKACVHNHDVIFGKQIITNYINVQTKTHSIQLLTTMIDFYGVFHEIESALYIFELIADSDRYPISAICVGAIMKALITNGYNEKALCIYKDYKSLHNDTTHLLAIKACINSNNFECGSNIINAIDIYESDELLNTVITFYGAFKDIENAERIFHNISDEKKKTNIEFINSMMDAYCVNKMGAECIQLFKSVIHCDGYEFDNITFAIALKGCIQDTAIHFGEYIHEYLRETTKYEWILKSLDVQINLIAMYGKCTKMDMCWNIFEDIKQHEYDKYSGDIMLWNALMNACGRNTQMSQMMQLFDRMRNETNLIANDRTYSILLNACSHCGDMERARYIWNNYVLCDEDIKKCVNVNTAYIDCLSRKGLLQEAFAYLLEYDASVEFDTNLAWISLLSGCNKYKNKELAQKVFDRFEEKFAHNHEYISSATILLSNIYASTN